MKKFLNTRWAKTASVDSLILVAIVIISMLLMPFLNTQKHHNSITKCDVACPVSLLVSKNNNQEKSEDDDSPDLIEPPYAAFQQNMQSYLLLDRSNTQQEFSRRPPDLTILYANFRI